LKRVPYVYDSEGGKGSLLLRVRSRSRWVGAAADLVALCDESARRRSLRADAKAAFYDSPLALEFVEDRLQLDEPLEGWMVKENKSGLLQGFITVTTFTTWVGSKNFKWQAKAIKDA
jgi:hypothetical protein